MIKLIQKLKALIVLPGEYIVMVGEHGEEMYLIKRGSVQVFVPRSKDCDQEIVLSTLSDGTFFGELALLQRQRRNASVRSLQYCHLMVLEKRGLESVMIEFPELRPQIEQVALTRQGQNLVKFSQLQKAGVMRQQQTERGRQTRQAIPLNRAPSQGILGRAQKSMRPSIRAAPK